MPVITFDDQLRQLGLLEQAQLDAIAKTLRPKCPDPKALARELVQRGWLTPYQVNQIAKGNAAELRLGSYVILERLGEGGMGAVFKARHVKMSRMVALKVIRKEKLTSAAAVQRFQREVKAAAHLNHPNIVQAHDADEANGTHFLAMEYVEGTDLHKLIQEKGPLPVAAACEYVRQAALGLQHAHKRGLVHRDIKPANLLLTRNADDGAEVVKILDMGIARMSGDNVGTLTQEGAVVGSLDYIAPEQAMSSHDVDARADLYSLGCTLYHLLTGKVPFPGGEALQKLMRHQHEELPPVEQLRPDVPAEVAAIVRKLMAKKPEDRFQSAADVATALASRGCQPPEVSAGVEPGSVHRGLTPPARPEKTVDSGEVWAKAADPANTMAYEPRKQQQAQRRKRWVLVAGAAAVALLLAVLGIGLFGQGSLPTPTSPQPGGPTTPPPGELAMEFTNSIGMKFVRVPAGTFWMGGGGGKPADKQVTIAKDFYIGVFEVTQEQWQAVMGNNPSAFSRAGSLKDSVKDITDADLSQLPVEKVSWEECQDFAKRLNEREKDKGLWLYRLPASAEWEYACRGAVTLPEECGFDYYLDRPTNTLTPDRANFSESKLGRPVKVGSYLPNRLGIYDMHGNVGECCDDLFGRGPDRTYRGGNLGNISLDCRARSLGSTTLTSRSAYLGLRLARVPADQPAVKPPDPPIQPPEVRPFAKIPGKDYHTNTIGMHFVKVPKGTFWMGGGGGKPGAKQATIEKDFYLGVFEVTQAQWQAVMGQNPSYFSRNGVGKDKVKEVGDADLTQFPVEQLSWDDCQEFVKRLNLKENSAGVWLYRLPTEAEWEFACRAGAASKEGCGFDYYLDNPSNLLLPDQANFFESKLGRPVTIGSYQPNRLGIYDMHGNVLEWCQDLVAPEASQRVYRGGGWGYDAGNCRAAIRHSHPPAYRDYYLGLRLVRVPSGQAAVKPPDPPIQPPEPRPFAKIPGKDYHTNAIGMHFVKVPKGTFWMGGGGGKPGDKQATIDKDFYMGVFEVTQEQWQAVMGKNPSGFSRMGGIPNAVKDITDANLAHFPVENVSWDDCQEFIKGVNAREKENAGWVYRLPTEAEWEYACRGAATTKEECSFDFYLDQPTNTLTAARANFAESMFGRPVPVGSYPPNRLGIHDMHGNIREWCQDLAALRVNRGGGWNNSAAANCRAASRDSNPPTHRTSNLGLRLARVPAEPEGK